MFSEMLQHSPPGIGCRFGHKLSMLETTLPWAQKRFGAEKVRIYADCEVRSTVDVGSHTLFLGEVVDAAFQKPEDTAVLRMEDTRMNYGG